MVCPLLLHSLMALFLTVSITHCNKILTKAEKPELNDFRLRGNGKNFEESLGGLDKFKELFPGVASQLKYPTNFHRSLHVNGRGNRRLTTWNDALNDVEDLFNRPLPWSPAGGATVGENCTRHNQCDSGYCRGLNECHPLPAPLAFAPHGCLVGCDECDDASQCVVSDSTLNLATECSDLNALAYIGSRYDASLNDYNDNITGFSLEQEALVNTSIYEDADDAVVADDNRTDNLCIFAFRGTDFDSPQDMLNNLNIFPAETCDIYSSGNCCPLMASAVVAYVFQDYEDELRSRILKCVEDGKQLVFTGHSQGAGAALAASTIFSSYKPWIILFGSMPSVWNSEAVGTNCPLHNAEGRIVRFGNTKVDEFFGGLWYDFAPHLNMFIDTFLLGRGIESFIPKPTSGDGPLCMLPPDDDQLGSGPDVLNVPYGLENSFDYVSREMACYESSDSIPYSWFGSFFNPQAHNMTNYRAKMKRMSAMASPASPRTNGFGEGTPCRFDTECQGECIPGGSSDFDSGFTGRICSAPYEVPEKDCSALVESMGADLPTGLPSDKPSGMPSTPPSLSPSSEPSTGPSRSVAPSAMPSDCGEKHDAYVAHADALYAMAADLQCAPSSAPSSTPSQEPSPTPSISSSPSSSPSKGPRPKKEKETKKEKKAKGEKEKEKEIKPLFYAKNKNGRSLIDLPISGRYENVTCSCLDGCMSEAQCDKRVKNAITLERHSLIRTVCNRDEIEFRGMATFTCNGPCPTISLELVGVNITTKETYGLDFGRFGSTNYGIPVVVFYSECVPNDLCYAFKFVPDDYKEPAENQTDYVYNSFVLNKPSIETHSRILPTLSEANIAGGVFPFDSWRDNDLTKGEQYMYGTPGWKTVKAPFFPLGKIVEGPKTIQYFGQCTIPPPTQSPTTSSAPSVSFAPSSTPSVSAAPTSSAMPTVDCITDFQHLKDEIDNANDPANPSIIIIGDGNPHRCPNKITFDSGIDIGGRYFVLKCGADPREECVLDLNSDPNQDRRQRIRASNSRFNIWLENMVVENGYNPISQVGGGAFLLTGKSGTASQNSATFTNCTFRNNVGNTLGGAIYAQRTSLTVDGCKFEKNRAVGDGGAIYTRSGVTATITDSCFTENKAALGGAIAVNGGLVTLVRNSFSLNVATPAPSSSTPVVNDVFQCRSTVTFRSCNDGTPTVNCRETNNTFCGTQRTHPRNLCNAGSSIETENCVAC